MDGFGPLPAAAAERPPSLFTLLREWRNWKVLLTSVAVMTLAINGGAVLPLAGTFASTGLVAATVLMAIVALANVYTNDILLWQCLATKQLDYETLSGAVAGPFYKFLTEVSLVVLMLGTLISGIQQLGEATSAGITFINPDYMGVWTNGSGRLIMVIAVVAVCAPLVFINGMRQLEAAGDVGIVINQVLVLVVVINCCQHGFPALGRSGQFEIVGFTNFTFILQMLGTYSYVFYIQPFSLAMLEEVPRGARGIRLLSFGTNIAILGTGIFVYWIVGFFGASRFGSDAVDVGNVLQNDLGGNGKGQGALNIIYTVYLVLSTPPFEYVARHSMLKWWASLAHRFPFMNVRPFIRKVVLAFLNYGFCLGISLAIPGKSAKVITVTGAVGSGFVCYLIPIVNHYLLYFGWARCSRAAKKAADDQFTDSARGNGGQGYLKAAPGTGKAEIVEPGSDADVTSLEKLGAMGDHEEPAPEDVVQETYVYPTFAAEGLGAKTIILRLGIPFLVVTAGMFVTIAVLVTINDE